jgi:hypothetical protein
MLSRDEVVEKRVAEAGELYRGVVRRAFAGVAPPRQAIRAQCLICVGYVRKDIAECSGFSCPLWKYRPYQEGGVEEDQDGPPVQEAPSGAP